jgi:hypothetical protein
VAATTPPITLSGWVILDLAKFLHRNTAGVYVISMLLPQGLLPIDVGQSEDIGERLANHDREFLWNLRRGMYVNPPALVVQIHATPWFEPYPLGYRLNVERQIWDDLRGRRYWLCGVRP